jgi:hypothetical protein
MRKLCTWIISIFLSSSCTVIKAQSAHSEWQLGYYAPFISNRGVAVGYAFEVVNRKSEQNSEAKRQNQIQFLAQGSYFTQLEVSHNYLVNLEWVYKWNVTQKRFFLSTSVGTAYLLSLQRQEGILNLSTGDIDYRYQAKNYFLPNVNFGLGIDPKKHVGFYLKATYGRTWSSQNAQATFLSLSTGMIVKFQ